jgi:hypothetical protein
LVGAPIAVFRRFKGPAPKVVQKKFGGKPQIEEPPDAPHWYIGGRPENCIKVAFCRAAEKRLNFGRKN